MIKKPCCSRFSLHKFVQLKFFLDPIQNMHLQGPCSLRPCISRPYCTARDFMVPIENNVSHLLLALPWWFSWPQKDICSAAQYTTSCQTWWGQAIKCKMRHFPYLSSSLSSTYLLLLLSSTVKILDDIIFHLQCFSTLLSSITLVMMYQSRV